MTVAAATLRSATSATACTRVSVVLESALAPLGSVVPSLWMDRSAAVLTVVPSVAELLAASGSVVELDTVAVLDRSAVREGSTCTVRVTDVDPEAAMVPSDQVTVPAENVPPPVAETNELPVGVGSVIVTACASDGPPFATDRV